MVVIVEIVVVCQACVMGLPDFRSTSGGSSFETVLCFLLLCRTRVLYEDSFRRQRQVGRQRRTSLKQVDDDKNNNNNDSDDNNSKDDGHCNHPSQPDDRTVREPANIQLYDSC